MTMLFTLLLSTVSFASERSFPVDAIKLADGKIAHCATQDDLGVVGYRPNLPVVLGAEKSVKLSFSVFGVVCAQGEDGFVWNLRPINDPFFTKARNGELVENFILKNEAVITNSEYTKEYGKQELANEGMQMVGVHLNLGDILSLAQQKALDEGHAVAVRVLYFHRATNEYVYQGKRQQGRLFVGGAYRFEFTLVKEDGAIKSTAVTIL
jgi:hypothetical protein